MNSAKSKAVVGLPFGHRATSNEIPQDLLQAIRQARPARKQPPADLNARESDRLNDAKAQWAKDAARDRDALAMRAPEPATNRRTFKNIRFAALARASLSGLAVGLSPSSDAVQDRLIRSAWEIDRTARSDMDDGDTDELILQSVDELRHELLIAQSATDGLVDDHADPALDGPIDIVATKLHDVAISSSRNRLSRKRSSVVVGDLRFTNPEPVGKGLWGEAVRYTHADSGQQVVVKSLMEEYAKDYRYVMASELRLHRHVMGRDGRGHPNVIGLKGIAVSDDGALHSVMEEARGGNLQNWAETLNLLGRWGVVPPDQRRTATRSLLIGAANGLKAVQDTGAVHLDLKALNYLLDEDGTVKMADFGSAKLLPEDGSPLPAIDVRVSRELAPPDTGQVTSKFDVFLFGEMLQGLMSDTLIEGELEQSGGHLINSRSDHGVSAFERLRNATLDPDQDQRPTIDGVLQSAFMSEPLDMPAERLQKLIRLVAHVSRLLPENAFDAINRLNTHDGRAACLARTEAELNHASPENVVQLEAQRAELQTRHTDAEQQAELDRFRLSALRRSASLQAILAETAAVCRAATS